MLMLCVSGCSGVGAMEIVAMDMKLRGTYIARQLSFKGVRFSIEEVPLPKDFSLAYDGAVEFVSISLWTKRRREDIFLFSQNENVGW